MTAAFLIPKLCIITLREYHEIVDHGHRLERFANLIYENREGLTPAMVEEFYNANRLEDKAKYEV